MGSLRILSCFSSFQRPIVVSTINGALTEQTQGRRYSIYPEFYIHPIFREEEQQKLKETGEADKYAFLPVRAAKHTDTSSVFYDALYDKVLNHIMRKGRKKIARNQLDKTFEAIKRVQLEKYYTTEDPVEKAKIIINPWELLHKAVENSKPFLETVPIKRGGHTYQVPVPIRPNKQQALAIKWLIEAGKLKDGDTRFYNKFSLEIIEAANNSGQVIKRKHELHKKCEANRAYAHYRWG